LVGAEQRQKPNALVRLAFAAIVLLLVWWVASKVMSFFDNSIGRKAGTTLELRTQDGVQVSLQGEDWQRDESDARMAVALVNKTHAELSHGKSFAELRNLPMRIRRVSEDRTVFGP
jgi:hypothetical protein